MEEVIHKAEPLMSHSGNPEVIVRDMGNGAAFCRAAFESLHIAIGGATKPCCEFKDEIAESERKLDRRNLAFGAVSGFARENAAWGARCAVLEML